MRTAEAMAVRLAAAVMVLAAIAGVPRWSRAEPSALPPVNEREARRDTTGLAGELLRGASPAIRASAARALGRIQNRGSVPALVRALGDRSPSVRHEAAFGLALVGDSTAAPAIVARLAAEPDTATRVALIAALGYMGARSGSPEIARELQSARSSDRWAAAFAAARSRDSSLVEPLARASKDSKAEMRWRVAYALGRIGDPHAGPALQALLEDKDPLVRSMAARAAGDAHDSTAVPALRKRVTDKPWRVRANAAHSLGVLKATDAAPELRALLRDPNPHVRWEAALALGAIRDMGAAEALTAALRDSASGVVQGAAIALLQIRGEDAVPVIASSLDLLPKFMRSGLIEALGDLTGPASLEILLARVRDSSDPPQAAGAASGLAKRTGDRRAAISGLRPALASKDFTVVASAADALGTLGDSVSVPELARLLSRRSSPDDADVAASAAGALAAIKTPEALNALRAAQHDPERRIRETAARGLGLPPDSVAAEPAPPLRVDAIPAKAATRAVVVTERGSFTISFHAKDAPRTVANFARLARSHYFDGLAYHRVVPNFVIQDGCPRGDGWGGPGYAIPCEYNERPYRIGTVGMALSGKDTGGSQWFVTLSPQPRLEGRYTVFGDVVSGMDVVERIMPGDRILRVEVK